MIRHEIARPQPVEQREGIARAQVPAPKSWLPPWRMTNRKQCDIKVAMHVMDDFAHESVRISGKRRIASEEARLCG